MTIKKQKSNHTTLHSYLLILGIIFVAFNLRPAITSVSPLIGEIIADTGLSSAMAGLFTALPVLSIGVFSLLAPKIARRFGIEKTIMTSLFILTIGIIIRSLPSITTLFLGTALIGISIAVGNVLLPSLVKHNFPLKIGLMTGLFTVSMNFWAGLAAGVSVPLSQGLDLGWRQSLICWAILSIIAIIIWLPQLRKRHAPPQGSGTSNGFMWRSGLAWHVTLFFGFQSMCYYTIVAWLPELLHDRGLSIESAGWMLALLQFVGLPANFLVPMLAGRLSNQKILVSITMLFNIIGFSGLFFGGTMLVPLWVFILGLGQGAAFGLGLTFISLRSSNAHQAADLSGMTQSLGYLFGAVAPVVFGYLHDLTYAWTVSLVFIIIVCILELIMGIGAGRNAYVSPKQVNKT